MPSNLSPNNLRRPTLTKGLAGWFLPNAAPRNAYIELDAMLAGLNTSLNTDTHASNIYSCAATDRLYPLSNISADSGMVAIIGHPQWKNAHLTTLAGEAGDSAALAAAYREDSNNFLRQLGGNFAFVIIDTANNTVLAGVDRLAHFPLYYAQPKDAQTKDGLVFGSSASTVLAHSGVERKILPQGIYDFIYFHMVPSPVSIYQGLAKLPAGHYLKYSGGKTEIHNYWQPHFSESSEKSFRAMTKELRPQLKSAVGRAVTDYSTTGAFLSGGLDSSSVTGMLSELSEGQTRAYSIGFAAEGYDEMAYARISAKKFGVKLNEYYVTPDDVVDALPDIATSYDEPFGNSSALPAYFCAKLAAEDGIKCLLAGDGGDEIFAGNERYAKQGVFEAYQQVPAALRSHLIEPFTQALPSQIALAAKAKSYIDQANVPLPERLQSYNFLNRHRPEEIFSSDFLAQINTASPTALQQQVYQRPADASTLNRMLYLDWQFTLADNDLRKVNHMCAVAGVDVTYPMLDDELLAFACQIPGLWKMKGKNLRHFYKKALHNWLPDETINKKKQGFGLPFGVWMQSHQPLQEMAYDNLLKLKKRQWLNPAFIDELIDLHRNGHAAYYGELIWVLTVLELWLDTHFSNA
ncbi:MAG: asparagine synthetase B [Candidatus Reddybacter sp.]